jgi:hypothetical protein
MPFALAQRAARLLAFGLVAGCNLQEVTLADPEDLVVAEITLRAGERSQIAFLHRTRSAGAVTVTGARIEVRSEAGSVMTFDSVSETQCIDFDGPRPATPVGSCYRSSPRAFTVQPGQHYTLRITLADGGVLTGETVVPDSLALRRPGSGTCRLPPDTTLELSWSRTPGAWVYVAETRLNGIQAALQARGVNIESDRVRLLGLAISGEDTTLVFPTEFGLFDRGDPDVADALIAIQRGLPPEVLAEVTVAAADRNYVNWERGGQFNPSGVVRIASIRGAGSGTFGSMAPIRFLITTGGVEPMASCF